MLTAGLGQHCSAQTERLTLSNVTESDIASGCTSPRGQSAVVACSPNEVENLAAESTQEVSLPSVPLFDSFKLSIAHPNSLVRWFARDVKGSYLLFIMNE